MFLQEEYKGERELLMGLLLGSSTWGVVVICQSWGVQSLAVGKKKMVDKE